MLKRSKNPNVMHMLLYAVASAFTILFVKIFFPSVIPFGAFEFWGIEGSVREWIWYTLPVFIWGGVLTFIHTVTTTNDKEINRDAEAILVFGGLISLWAGVMEEVSFRWLIFLANVVWVKVGNFFLLGFMGLGIPKLFYSYVLAPMANLTTIGYLEPYLWHNAGWAVGASLLTTNAFFRDGHKYQGLLGWIDSWFFGMYCFWLLFNYGLVACIFVHVLYDMFIFFICYVDAAIERACGFL